MIMKIVNTTFNDISLIQILDDKIDEYLHGINLLSKIVKFYNDLKNEFLETQYYKLFPYFNNISLDKKILDKKNNKMNLADVLEDKKSLEEIYNEHNLKDIIKEFSFGDKDVQDFLTRIANNEKISNVLNDSKKISGKII